MTNEEYDEARADRAYQEMKDANAERGLPPRDSEGHSFVYWQKWTQ